MGIFKKRGKRKEESDDVMTQSPKRADGIENYTVETFKKSNVIIGKVHSMGKRKNQEDTFAYSDVTDESLVRQKGMLLLVADGMGGMSNGATVSATVAVEALRYFDSAEEWAEDIPQRLEDMAQCANSKVNEVLGEEWIGRSGSTLVAMHIKDNAAYWLSIGDSLIYLYRGGELFRLNKPHNYEAQLAEKVQNGEMTLSEAMAEPDKAALTSYIGAGEIALIDQNTEPLQLECGDKVVLMSDGVETASETEMCGILQYDAHEAALKLRYLIDQKNKRNQDNFTAIIAEIK